MSFLGDEIAKLKRKAPADKYLKRSEVEAARVAEYEQKQEQLKRKREAAEEEKLDALRDREAKRYQAQSVKKLEPAQIAAIRKELIALQQPILLFGETDQDVLERLENIKAAKERAAQTNESILEAAYGDTDSASSMTSLSVSAMDKPEHIIHFLQQHIAAWGAHDKSDDEFRRYTMARQHLARLIIRLQADNLPADVMKNLTLLCQACLKQDFQAANLAYLDISIGNAAWPVGLTYTGIHERAQRERKSHEINSAHVLDDESTRQWLQSLKRLLTFIESQA